jgi:hypothetical protein
LGWAGEWLVERMAKTKHSLLNTVVVMFADNCYEVFSVIISTLFEA